MNRLVNQTVNQSTDNEWTETLKE